VGAFVGVSHRAVIGVVIVVCRGVVVGGIVVVIAVVVLYSELDCFSLSNSGGVS
jgi:hypothetical protein